MEKWLEQFRHRLATVDAVPQLALMGVLVGAVTALIIFLFRFVIETTQRGLLPDADVENYEGLAWQMRLLLPVGGALAISFIWSLVSARSRQVGVVHVLERLAYNQGYLPLKNLWLQFLSATISIVSGHSVGREGPSVHIGAASGSLLGQWLKLPDNSLRTLIACGAAASIAAAFNTPIAGVIFAMEVIVMEYSIAGFTPIIVAAVSATVLTRSVLGSSAALVVPPVAISGMWEYLLIVVLGLLLGALAALFNKLTHACAVMSKSVNIWGKFIFAGTLTGVVAIFVPQIMGIGYDTLNAAMAGEITFWLLIVILLAKLFVTAISIGIGLPGGLIGPSLVIGAVAGAFLGAFALMIFPGNVASTGFYAMLGMGAMMAAVLQAPLAALMALLEFTVNADIILPGMLAVIIASMTSRHIFASEGIFSLLLKARGLDYSNHPIAQSLRRAAVSSVMSASFIRLPAVLQTQDIEEHLADQPSWVVIQEQPGDRPVVLRTADLALALKSEDADEISLTEIQADRCECECISGHATLQQAFDMMLAADRELLCVVRHYRPVGADNAVATGVVIGILSKEMIGTYYQYP
ncbi:MAG: chloride channel protein [Thiohalomonadales bacterium]